MCGICGAAWTDPSGRDPGRIAPGDDGPARPPRPGRRGRPTATTMPRWGSAGCRSSTWPAAISRSRTRTAPSGPSSTARSTTTPRSGAGWRPRGTRSARRATPRSSCTCTRTRGRGCSACLRGMFALAIWDAPRRTLVLARDRMGQKPLVYRHDHGAAAWPSPASSRRCWPCPRTIVPRRVDPLALDQYLCYGYVPHPRTILEGVAKLPPAHYRGLARRRAGDRALLVARLEPRARAADGGGRRGAAARPSTTPCASR